MSATGRPGWEARNGAKFQAQVDDFSQHVNDKQGL